MTSSHISRRQLLKRTACGIGQIGLLGLLDSVAQGEGGHAPSLRNRHFAPKAKSAIFLFMHGGVSHLDTFDPKPKLDQMDGKDLPYQPSLQFAPTGKLKKSPWTFRRYGASGLPVSDLFPHVGSVIDDICLLRSMHVEQVDHGGAVLQLHTGSAVFPRPSVGSWLVYGLGTENKDLPGFITISPPLYHGSTQNYSSGFLPASFQGTALGETSTPMSQARIANLNRAEPSRALQRLQLDFLQDVNRRHQALSPDDSRLNARIETFELAFRMQREAPVTVDISGESGSTLGLYGIGKSPTDNFGRQCLLARRLVERGVRVVQCTHSYKWDQHSNLKGGHEGNAAEVDQPIAGLIKDLKQRGLLDETLVVWGTEFGRTPMNQGGSGRDHNPYGFTLWMAGGGVKGGIAYGATDELGYHAAENRTSMYDLHATVLHLMGIDHEKLTYRYNARDFRLTDVYGKVVHDIIG